MQPFLCFMFSSSTDTDTQLPVFATEEPVRSVGDQIQASEKKASVPQDVADAAVNCECAIIVGHVCFENV